MVMFLYYQKNNSYDWPHSSHLPGCRCSAVTNWLHLWRLKGICTHSEYQRIDPTDLWNIVWVICWSGFGVYGPAKTLGRIEPFWLVPSWMLETTSSVYCRVLNLFLFFARTSSSFPNLLFGYSPDGHRQWIQQIFQGIVFVWFPPLVLLWKCNIIVWLRDILSWAKLVSEFWQS